MVDLESEDTSNRMQGSGSSERSGKLTEKMRQNLREKSPEELREASKKAVAKGMAAVVGSTEGFVEQHEPRAVADAARVTAETIRHTTEAAREEIQGARQDLGIPPKAPKMEPSESEGPGVGEKAREMGTRTLERGKEATRHAAERSREMAKTGVERGREFLRDKEPDEVRQAAKENVGKVVASGTGAAEGWVEQSNPRAAGEAVHKVGQTVREAGKAVKEEVKGGAKETLGTEAGSKSSAVSSSLREEDDTSGGI